MVQLESFLKLSSVPLRHILAVGPICNFARIVYLLFDVLFTTKTVLDYFLITSGPCVRNSGRAARWSLGLAVDFITVSNIVGELP